MDVVERLTLQAAQADTMLAREHRHRYEFAAGLCAGLRVVDLCCGSGYGSAILAEGAKRVLGVDIDVATVDTASATLAREHENANFQPADAVAFLRAVDPQAWDGIVCFEGLEHLRELDEALALLRGLAREGMKIVASVPNSRTFGEHNAFHVTDFGFEEAKAAFAGFPQTVMVPQYLAEGSVICPPGARGSTMSIIRGEHAEPEYANHFIFCVNFDPDAVPDSDHASVQVTVAPIFNRWSEGIKQALDALRRENTRLARGRLGKSGSAAASALASLQAREQRLQELELRCQLAEARVRELESGAEDGIPGGADAADEVRAPEAPQWPVSVVVAPPQGAVAAAHPGEDPNSWEHRRLRAAEYLIPWIEQTVPLAGRTVLEYGCGNGAVSCAFAEHAERLIGLDIDPDWIEHGNREIAQRGLENVELQLHPPDSILAALESYRGKIDILLLYAVLEHMTVTERLSLLRLAREVVKPDGAIVIAETPNRLVYFDHHTAQMPFFHLLPDELALQSYGRSPRGDFRAAIENAEQHGPAAALEAIARWGRGVSFHEFEVAFGDLSRHVIASSYDMLLFGERPVHPEETILARYLDRVRPDLAPVFSRYWLDLILSPTAVERRSPFMRPWAAETLASPGADWTRGETLRLDGPQALLRIELPHPTSRLVLGAVAHHERPFSLTVRPEGTVGGTPVSCAPRPAHQTLVSFSLDTPTGHLEVEASDRCELVFVGFED